MPYLVQYLGLGAILFALGLYGVVARKNAVTVLMAVELMLAAVNVNLAAFGAYQHSPVGQLFAVFVVAIAAAEVGVGLAIVLFLYRRSRSVDLDVINDLKG